MIEFKFSCFSVLNFIILTRGQNCSKTATTLDLKTFTENEQNPCNETKPQNTNQSETDILRLKLNQTEHHLYQLEWKVILQQMIQDYETLFDEVELLKLHEPIFKVNETSLNLVKVSANFDRVAERRTQRWIFYLEHPIVWNSFRNLVERVKRSNFTEKEFCIDLARLYKRLSMDILGEAMHYERNERKVLSSYNYSNFHYVIRLLLENPDIFRTRPIRNMFNELNTVSVGCQSSKLDNS